MIYRFLSTLPFWLLYTVAWLGYLILFYLVRYRREVVHNNLTRAFPEKKEQEINEAEQEKTTLVL